jgi:hypothetical protein
MIAQLPDKITTENILYRDEPRFSCAISAVMRRFGSSRTVASREAFQAVGVGPSRHLARAKCLAVGKMKLTPMSHQASC